MTAVAELLGAVRELEAWAVDRLAKASAAANTTARDALVEPFAAELAEYFTAMAGRVTGTVRKAVETGWDPGDIDWTFEESELAQVLGRWVAKIGEAAFGSVGEQLLIEIRFDVRVSPGREILAAVGERVAGITDTSRELLEGAVERAIASGDSTDELRVVLEEIVTGWSSSRAQTIALTETAMVYNQAALAGYAESGLTDEVEVFDGEDCGWTSHDDPDLASGSRRSLDDAEAYPISHPNCQRAFGPVVAR